MEEGWYLGQLRPNTRELWMSWQCGENRVNDRSKELQSKFSSWSYAGIKEELAIFINYNQLEWVLKKNKENKEEPRDKKDLKKNICGKDRNTDKMLNAILTRSIWCCNAQCARCLLSEPALPESCWGAIPLPPRTTIATHTTSGQDYGGPTPGQSLAFYLFIKICFSYSPTSQPLYVLLLNASWITWSSLFNYY